MKKIISILQKRDGLTKQEAIDLCKECYIAMQDSIITGNVDEAEEIFMSYLGLEIDYLPEFIMFG